MTTVLAARAEIIPPTKETDIQLHSSNIVIESRGYVVIAHDEHRDRAVAFGKRLKIMREQVAALYDEPIANAHRLHKDLCNRKKALDGPLSEAEIAVRRGVGEFEARKRAEIERQRQAELAEIRRKAEEAERDRQRILDEARRTEEDFQLAEAERLAAAGKTAEADAVLAQPIVPTKPLPPPVAPEPVKLSSAYKAPQGVRTRQTWKFRIVDVSKIPREYMVPNELTIGQVVRALKADTQIPGIEVYTEAMSGF